MKKNQKIKAVQNLIEFNLNLIEMINLTQLKQYHFFNASQLEFINANFVMPEENVRLLRHFAPRSDGIRTSLRA